MQGVAAAALENEAMRQNLPIGFASGSASADDRERIYREKFSVLLSSLNSDELWRYFESEVMSANVPLFKGVMSGRLDSNGLEAKSAFRKRPSMPVAIETCHEYCVVRFSDREVRLPGARAFCH